MELDDGVGVEDVEGVGLLEGDTLDDGDDDALVVGVTEDVGEEDMLGDTEGVALGLEVGEAPGL